jgi:hypothetical protein
MRLYEATPYIKHLFEIYQSVCNQRADIMRRVDFDSNRDQDQDVRSYMWEDVVGAARDLYEAMTDFLNENHYIKFNDYGFPSYLYAENITFALDRLDNYDVTPTINKGNSYAINVFMQGYRIPWKDEIDCNDLNAMIITNSWVDVDVITREEFEEKTAGALSLDEASAKLKVIEDAKNKARRSCTNIRRNNPKYQHIKHSIKQLQLYIRYLKNLKEKFDRTIYQEAFSDTLPPELVSCLNSSELEGRDYSWVDSYNSSIKQEIMNNGGIPDIDLL